MRVLTEKIRKNYTHHTTTNKPQRIHRFVWWMLASTIQFSHNTPHHPEQTTTTQQQFALTWCEHQDQPINNGLLSQTPNSAPTIYLEKFMSVYMLQKIPVTNPYMVGGVFPLRFNNGGMTTFGPSTTNPTTP